MCMWDDGGEMWELTRRETRRARKEHRCGECGRTIGKGETYEYLTGLIYGHWDTERTCEQCIAAARWLTVVCEGWLYQGVQQDLGEHVVGHESYLRTAPLTRLYRWMLADWRNRAGDLRPVEDVRAVASAAIEAYERQLTASGAA